MNTRLIAITALLAAVSAAAQPVPHHRDINATQVNADTRRAELIFYPSEEEALAVPFEKSPNYLCLNGEWDFLYFDSEKQLPVEFSGWGKIKVPGNWEFQGHGVPVYSNIRYEFAPDDPQPPLIPEDDPVGVYRRTFTVPDAWKGREVYLNLCGVKSGCYTYVNGHEAGYSEDSKDLARFDITPYLKDGENTLVLKMFRWSSGSYLECQDFWRVSGIERDVYLSSEQVAYNLGINVVSTLDDSFRDGIFRFRASSSAGAPVTYKLLDKDGTVVAEGAADGSARVIPDVRRWTAETPELYTLLIRAGEEYTRFDVGFRHLQVKGNVFYVNGQPVKFKGVNLHEHSQYTGHYLTREDLRAHLLRMRELNVNAIRTCHYPQQRAFYELCDSLGFYVYDEANVESHGMGYGERTLANNPAWFAKHQDRILNMYMRTASYPCVTILSLGNEAGNGVNFTRMYDSLKELERGGQNRPVVYERAVGGHNTDFLNPMYPDTRWLHNQGELPSAKPVVLCEYSHAMGNSNGSFDWMWMEFYGYDNLQGGFIWDWIDQGVLETAPNGRPYWTYGGDYGAYPKYVTDWNFNCNGVLNPDLDPHPAAVEIKHWYQNVWVSAKDAADGVFTVENRNYFRDLSGYTLSWELTRDGLPVVSGSEENLHAAPQGSQDLDLGIRGMEMDPSSTYCVNFRIFVKAGDTLLPEGYEVASDQFLLQKGEKAAPALGKPMKVKDKGDRFELRSWRSRVVVDKTTGEVKQIKLRGKNLIDPSFGMRPNFWRPLVDNDWGYGYPYRGGSAFLPDSVRTESVTAEGDAVKVLYGLPTGNKFAVVYRAGREGRLLVSASFKGVEDVAVAVPRIGFRMRVASAPGRFRYFGRGPGENYVDRNSATMLGLYEASVKDQYYPYVRPQETGHHTETEWLEAGALRVEAEGFEFNLLDVAQEDLCSLGEDGAELYRHVSDVDRGHFAELCLDFGMTGVGGYDSWGQRPEPLRTLWSGDDCEFVFVMGRK